MLSNMDKAIIREIQEDIPLCPEPFKEIANRLKIEEQELLTRIEYLIENKYIRRFGASLRHREMGLTANPMIVWQVPDERLGEVGEQLAAYSQVTHCYSRPMLPKLPYNLFSMIHGESWEECVALAKAMAQAVGIREYQLLFSEQELKKTSMKYFVE